MANCAYKPVQHCDQIDLKKHALIEASAGTGKTYTIENLVVRLLEERADISLENILLVTFTEKATSELKIRIREKIAHSLDTPNKDAVKSRKLQNALDVFDRAPIHTIHGFCQTVLRDFAFENGTVFQSEVIPDAPLFERLLKDQMRTTWPEKYGKDLKEVLEISGFSRKKDAFLETVIHLARFFHGAAGDKLLPDLKGMGFQDIRRDIQELERKTGVLLEKKETFSKGYEQLNFNKRAKNSILDKIVIPLETHFHNGEEKNSDIGTLLKLMTRIQETVSSGRKGVDCLIPTKWNKGGPNLDVCPRLNELKEILEKISRKFRDLECSLTVEAIHQLQKDVALTKRNLGLISYYDMLALVEKALYADNATVLIEKLRNRYHVAFIDEFQDTDPIQWRIFKRLFIEDYETGQSNRLFLIGDPKQAIYSFRGADVYAYLGARSEMEKIAAEGRAALYSLTTNWRSQPEMIQTFNTLFCRHIWFRPQEKADEFEIGYQNTDAPPENLSPRVVTEDGSGRSSLTIVDLSAATSPRPAKTILAQFIAREIEHLISSTIRTRERNGGERHLGFGDICVLVRTRSEAMLLEEELTSREIPYTFYKKPGLFVSPEAMFISLLFHAIRDPGNDSAVKKALLTPFFGFQLSELFAYEEMLPSHPVKRMLFEWNGFAEWGKWNRLFQSVVEDSGLLFRETGKTGWDRKHTNYRQIFEYLEDRAYRENLDFRGLSAALDILRKESSHVHEDVGIHQIETESKKVQIMTMHVSKGLEFPIVFVAGGLTQRADHLDTYHTYHEIEKNDTSSKIVRMVDLTKSSGHKKHEREQTDENKRLFYVAATRAQIKLYLPFYQSEKKASWLGPVCTLVSPALLSAFQEEKGEQTALWVQGDNPADVAQAKLMEKTQSLHAPFPVRKRSTLFPSTGNYRSRRIRLESFSSLHRKMGKTHEGREESATFQATNPILRENDEGFAPESQTGQFSESTLAGLPGGPHMGLLFHDILEFLDYRILQETGAHTLVNPSVLLENPSARDLISGRVAFYGIDPVWKGAICGIVCNTLTAPILSAGKPFTLAQIRKEDRRHEMEFYYPFPVPFYGYEKIPGFTIGDGFIRGFVDLIFQWGGKFYIADWKSNILEAGYDQESMELSMVQSQYHLQYRLYAIATVRWLKQALGNRFDPEKHFGGVFYFYLRGMDSKGQTGIYHIPSQEMGTLEQIEKEVREMIE